MVKRAPLTQAHLARCGATHAAALLEDAGIVAGAARACHQLEEEIVKTWPSAGSLIVEVVGGPTGVDHILDPYVLSAVVALRLGKEQFDFGGGGVEDDAFDLSTPEPAFVDDREVCQNRSCNCPDNCTCVCGCDAGTCPSGIPAVPTQPEPEEEPEEVEVVEEVVEKPKPVEEAVKMAEEVMVAEEVMEEPEEGGEKEEPVEEVVEEVVEEPLEDVEEPAVEEVVEEVVEEPEKPNDPVVEEVEEVAENDPVVWNPEEQPMPKIQELELDDGSALPSAFDQDLNSMARFCRGEKQKKDATDELRQEIAHFTQSLAARDDASSARSASVDTLSSD